ncbi:MAG: serine/threonine-protein kinase [Lentisphaeria bacterium]|nr:serine/threonine-protein kinase [Lentisphaeria bacterium]
MAKYRKGSQVDCYKLGKRLGGGASAVVHLAEVTEGRAGVPLEVGDSVAIKLYKSELLGGYQTLRIHREFSVAAELQHANIIRVYDLLISPSRDLAFLAMEYVEGDSLKDYIKKNGPLSAEQTICIARQLFSAINEIHEFDALHRDVKPANVLLVNGEISEDPPTVKLADLGIVFAEDGAQLTQPSDSLASKHYASYEQLLGEVLDARADIYSIGAVMFHCITGKEPYAGAGPATAISVRMFQDYDIWSDFSTSGSIDVKLKSLIDDCLSRDRERRPFAAEECLERLDNLNLGYGLLIGCDSEHPDPSSLGWRVDNVAGKVNPLLSFGNEEREHWLQLRPKDGGYAQLEIDEDVARIAFEANFVNGGGIYLYVTVHKEGNGQKVWMLIPAKPVREGKVRKHEWILKDFGKREGNRITANIDVAKAVQKTWGTEGWEYGQLLAIRLRGEMDLSPIQITPLEK